MNTNVLELLALIRKRPEMYLGASSVTLLGIFLEGYYFAKWEMDNEYSGFIAMKKFQDVVAERFSIEQSISWDRILAFVAGDERKGFDLFWKLWDEYTSDFESAEAPLPSE